MQTTKTLSQSQNNQHQRPFSLPLYLLLVFGLSWPFQIAYAIWGTTSMLSYLLSSMAMVMVTVATFIAGHFIFRDGFSNAGWRWGKPKQYGIALVLAAFIFLVPTLLEFVFRLRSQLFEFSFTASLGSFVGYLLITLIPGFGEEFGWRAYLLPHLVQRYTPRKALLVHSFIWWAWHIPSIIAIAINEAESGAGAGASIVFFLVITLIPAMGNAVIYAYVWTTTQSLAVSTFYHSAYDEVRDAIERTVGAGPLLSPWEMLVTTILGGILLWKANWKPLENNPLAEIQPSQVLVTNE
jgi:membrane protease YdiL (CAAX protease family)